MKQPTFSHPRLIGGKLIAVTNCIAYKIWPGMLIVGPNMTPGVGWGGVLWDQQWELYAIYIR